GYGGFLLDLHSRGPGWTLAPPGFGHGEIDRRLRLLGPGSDGQSGTTPPFVLVGGFDRNTLRGELGDQVVTVGGQVLPALQLQGQGGGTDRELLGPLRGEGALLQPFHRLVTFPAPPFGRFRVDDSQFLGT